MHEKLVRRLGNLTLLAGELNIRASNNPFLAKQKEYAKSEISLTRRLCDYKDFRFEEIEARTCELAKYALEIWSF